VSHDRETTFLSIPRLGLTRAAAKNIVMMDLAILQAEAAAGMQEADRRAREGSPLRAVAGRGSCCCHRGLVARRTIAGSDYSGDDPCAVVFGLVFRVTALIASDFCKGVCGNRFLAIM
jgi:hypothetical protein